VIEAVHIQEIIDTVDYLIDYGVWTSIPVCTRKRTPAQFMGRDCGYHYAANYHDRCGTPPTRIRRTALRGDRPFAACNPVSPFSRVQHLQHHNIEGLFGHNVLRPEVLAVKLLEPLGV